MAGTWDRQQEHLLPDREERFTAMFDVVDAVAGAPRRVLDLACGPGSITVRLLRRFPGTTATLVDVDPALLAIAAGVPGGDARVQIVQADLAGPGWATALPPGGYDAVLTANSLHWLNEAALRRVYSDLAGLIRPGGVACNADPMAPDGGGQLIEALERRARQVQPALPEGELDWEDWWQAAAANPVLAPLVAARNKRFGGETHPPDFTPPLAWHTAALRAAGFTDAGCIWRHGIGAIVAALR